MCKPDSGRSRWISATRPATEFSIGIIANWECPRLIEEKVSLFQKVEQLTSFINPYYKKLGPIFPYIEDTFKKKIKTIRVATGSQYPRIHINYYRDNVLLFYKPYIHNIIAEAFIENPLPKKLTLVHHKNNNPLDYRIGNLQHVSRSFNSQGVAKPKHGTGHDDYLANHYIRSTKKWKQLY